MPLTRRFMFGSIIPKLKGGPFKPSSHALRIRRKLLKALEPCRTCLRTIFVSMCVDVVVAAYTSVYLLTWSWMM